MELDLPTWESVQLHGPLHREVAKYHEKDSKVKGKDSANPSLPQWLFSALGHTFDLMETEPTLPEMPLVAASQSASDPFTAYCARSIDSSSSCCGWVDWLIDWTIGGRRVLVYINLSTRRWAKGWWGVIKWNDVTGLDTSPFSVIMYINIYDVLLSLLLPYVTCFCSYGGEGGYVRPLFCFLVHACRSVTTSSHITRPLCASIDGGATTGFLVFDNGPFSMSI